MANVQAQEITLTRPDDWHVHLRDGDALSHVVAHTAFQFARAIVMPNLKPPVTTTKQALEYKGRILRALGQRFGQTHRPAHTQTHSQMHSQRYIQSPMHVHGENNLQNLGHAHDSKSSETLNGSGWQSAASAFEPLMTLYLTDTTTAQELHTAHAAGVLAVKLYPSGATTNSDSGVTDIRRTYPALEALQRLQMPLLIHAEVTDPEVDLFDREAVFIDRHLLGLRRDFPELKIVLEHITTKEGAQFVSSADDKIAATITAHHLLYNRNALFAGGVRPHYYCLPVLKRESHRTALLSAATSTNPRFFLGTDSAPHAAHLKENACGCAGCYTAFSAMELYAEAFDSVDALDRLEAFASFNGADFYGLPRNTGRITLKKESSQMPESLSFGASKLIPLRAGEALAWRFVHTEKA